MRVMTIIKCVQDIHGRLVQDTCDLLEEELDILLFAWCGFLFGVTLMAYCFYGLWKTIKDVLGRSGEDFDSV